MASADIGKIGRWDARLINSPPVYGVNHGAASVSSYATIAANASAANHVYNIAVPGISMCIDRFATWTASVIFRFTVSAIDPATRALRGVPFGTVNAPVVASGTDFALAAYPLHRLTTNMAVTINGQQVSLTTASVLNTLLRMNDSKTARSVLTNAAKLDVYANCAQGTGGAGASSASSPYSCIDSAVYGTDPGNGAQVFQFCDATGAALAATGTAAAPLAWTGDIFNGSAVYQSVNGIPVLDGVHNQYPIYVRYQLNENLLISPFVSGDAAAGMESALSGIQQMVFNFQMQSPFAGRVIRQLSGGSLGVGGMTITDVGYGPGGATGSPFTNASITLVYLKPPLTLYVTPTNVVPYHAVDAFPFSQNSALGAGQTGQLTTNAIQINSVPDLIAVRVCPYTNAAYPTSPGWSVNGVPQGVNGAATEAEWVLPIVAVQNMGFDGQTGLLASISQVTLWRMSVENGLRMPWLQWSGQACTSLAPGAVTGGMNVVMSGGELVLQFGKDVQLASQLASGVSGSFAISFTLIVQNPLLAAITPQVSLITFNSGFISSAGGATYITTTPLLTQDVLATSLLARSVGGVVSNVETNRLLGSGWQGKSSASIGGAASLFSAPRKLAAPPASAGGGRSGGAAPPPSNVVDALAARGYGHAKRDGSGREGGGGGGGGPKRSAYAGGAGGGAAEKWAII